MHTEELMNIVNLEKPNELQKAMSTLQSQLPEMINYVKMTAQLRKVSYDALIKEGFIKEEALELCKTSLSL